MCQSLLVKFCLSSTCNCGNSLHPTPRVFAGFVVCALLIILPALAVGQDRTDFDDEFLKVQDILTLKSGVTLYGKLISVGTYKDDGRKFVVFKTADGVLKLDKGKLVKGDPRVIDETGKAYDERLAKMEDTAEAHREMAIWCEDQKKGRLFHDQVQFHRERVMKLDPNDSTVKRKLGFREIEDEDGGKHWVSDRHFHESIGYVKDGTGWISSTQLAANEADRTMRSQGLKLRAFRAWKKKLEKKSRKESDAEMREELYSICDADGVRIVFEQYREESSQGLRREYINAIGRIATPSALNALVGMAVMDLSDDNRDRALDMLAQKHFSTDAAALRMASVYLKNHNNMVVKRAGAALGILGSEKVILQLAQALETTHVKVKGGDPNRKTFSFGDGQMGGMSIQGNQPVIGNIKNDSVLAALKKITGQDFVFNESRWQQWYVKNHTHYDLDLRGER